MSQPEINNVSINDSWSLMNIFQSIRKILRSLNNKFSSSPRDQFTQDESGELMRRYMARQSWFDKISYNWINQSFFQKASYIIGITLFAGFIGLFIGSPMILALFTGFIAFTVHSMLESHEQDRQESAKIFAAETITLNGELRESKKVMNEKIIELGQQVQSLRNSNATMSKHVSKLQEENEKITHQNEELIAQTDRLKEKASALTVQQTAVEVKFKEISTQLEDCSQEISRTTENVATIDNTVSEFSEVVNDARQSQIALSQAANSFCLFVNEQAQQRKEVPDLTDSSDDFLDRLLKQNEEDDALVLRLGLNN